MGRNIYIELGVCHLKYNTKPFYESHKEEEWFYYLFEPNRFSLENIRSDADNLKIPNLEIIPKAVWSEDCKKNFWLGTRQRKDGTHKERGGASLLSGKRFLGLEEEEVECIDIDKWIRDNLSKDDYIHLRMDIEGAEYYVLPKMIDGGSIDYIDCFTAEFHAHKFKGENRENLIAIHKDLRDYFSKCKNIDIIRLQHIDKI